MSNLWLLIFGLIMVLVCRGWMAAGVRVSMSKSNWKKYIINYGILNRWFFISAASFSDVRYSKFEKRKINFPAVLSFYRTANIIMHGAWLMLLVVFLCFEQWFEQCFFWYLCFAMGIILSMLFTNLYTSWRRHKNRYR
ncbi:MAG: hypothetical protein IKC09_00230 [Oscillospiraceae bacterium]|nr:hypothetical protein [Oscillospiraceae bacterium]